jgi:hypothetical protein
MSAEAVTVVLHHSRSEGTAKLVLWGIANHHSDAGAWPSIATLAKYAAVSERRVQQIIRDLEKLGEIAIDEQGGLGQGQYKTNRYHILIQCPADCDGSLNHRTGVKSGAIRGEIQSQPGVKPVSPELNKELNKKNTSVDVLFNEFWKEYPMAPKFRTERKQDAFKEFKSALTRASFEDILAGAIAYRNDPKENRYKLIAVKWLRNDGWETAASQPQQTESYFASERRVKEREATEAYLRQQREAQVSSAPKLCKHGKTIALCLPCAKETNG